MEEQKKEQLIEIHSHTRQVIFRKLARFCSETKGNDLYFLYEATQLLIADIGDAEVKGIYGEKYEFECGNCGLLYTTYGEAINCKCYTIYKIQGGQ